MVDPLKPDAWMQRVLGVSVALGKAPSGKPVRFSPVADTVDLPDGQPFKLGVGQPRSGRVIAPPTPPARPRRIVAKDGKQLAIAEGANGCKVYTSPPPPVQAITFSGGGGKGIALPGAVRALHDSGVLNDCKQIAGASVGSMTAALVAAGITADEFQRVADDAATTDAITEGTGGTLGGMVKASLKNLFTKGSANPLTGDGLENIVRGVLDETLRKRIQEHCDDATGRGEAPSPEVLSVAKAMSTLGIGPTFGHLRQLSRVIPAVKEVVITGTYTDEFQEDDDGDLRKLAGGDGEAQLYVFSADTEPELEVAVAVHASASFPMVFKPVNIKLASGKTVRFIDGGVMNNTPTQASLAGTGDEMDRSMLDPVPEGRGMTFVFEDDSTDDLLEGEVAPSQGLGARFQDWLLGANNAGAEYAKNLAVADKPEEVVVVPLRMTVPADGEHEAIDVDMTGMLGGTLKFQVEPRVALALQNATEQATLQQVAREQQPRSREFRSDAQMFVSIPLVELQALSDDGYEGATEALVMRTLVTEKLGQLRQAVQGSDDIASALASPEVQAALRELATLAGSDVDYQGYVAREMNRGGLDELLAAARSEPDPDAPAELQAIMKAGCVVADALKTHDHAERLLKKLIYPKMKTERKGGSGIELLKAVQRDLRSAVKPQQVNEAIDTLIEHFHNKSDRILVLKRGHKKFAQDLAAWYMKITS